MGSPMAAPQNANGKLEAARVNIHLAMNMLEQALPAFGSETTEGKAIIRTLSSLAKDFGKKDAGDLVPAEIMSMVRSMPQMGGGSPVQRALIQQMQHGNMPPQQPGPPGAPPPGA